LSVGSHMNPTNDAIREEAASWFARRRDGVHTSSEEAAFESWHGRSEAHVRAYAETERAWEQWKQLQGSARMREMAAAAMAATASGRRQANGGRWWPLLAAACLAAVAVFGGIRWLPLMMRTQPVVYSTALGEQRTEQLPDGTRIVLNTQTTLQVRYSPRQREVFLQQGEAMFDVVHDAMHPFRVIAGDGSVTDLGTQFQVRNEDGLAAVTLLQGRVEVVAQDGHKQLVPGEQARYGAGITGIDVRRVETGAITSWMRGRLDFSSLPLGQAVTEANRYSAVKLRLGDPRLASLPVGGSFRAGDNTAIAAALSAVFPVRVARSDAHEIVLMPR
jgi:transmembrane sensor